jgi:hypothetical protein
MSSGAALVERRGPSRRVTRVVNTARACVEGTPTEPKTSAAVCVLHHGSGDLYHKHVQEGSSNGVEGMVGHRREDCCVQPRLTTLRHRGRQPERRESR